MKILIKTIPVLLLFSFLSISWMNFNDEKPEVDCLVQLGSDILIDFWDSPQIDALVNRPLSEIDEIIWSPSENLSCTDCLNPILTLTEAEDVCISLNVKFNDGCEATDDMCIIIAGCGGESNFTENNINSITPQSITDFAEIELEIAQFQFGHIEIVENDEITHTLFEGWLGGKVNKNLDFSEVPVGNHSLRVRLYPENMFISITKL